MTQATWDVVPQNGGWLVRMAGDSISEWHAMKAEAVRRARELGRPYDVWRVRVYSPAGTLEQELTSSQEATH
jgi:hypothetical protein